MDWSAVSERIERGEDHATEFKRELDSKQVAKALAAFANTDGGLAIVGVDDAGSVVGVAGDPERIAERLTSLLQTSLSSPVQAKLGRHQTPVGWVHWVEVPRQRGFEPVRCSGVVYVRRRRSSVEPSPAELADLYNAFGYVVTEERTVAAAAVNDIDVQAFSDYLRKLGLALDDEPRLPLEDDLRARGVIAAMGDELRPTVYGILAFGLRPQSYPQTQNFFVECVSYGGLDRAARPLDVATAKGRLDVQVDRALGWLAGQPRREEYHGATRVDIPLLPVAAAREVIVNAVAHRDYAIVGSKILVERFTDRVEVTSPGRLPNGITVESVRRGGNPRSRNQSITNYLLTMGKMEQRGRGWAVVRHAMQTHNGTEPEIEEDRDARWLRVTLRTAP